MMIFIYIPETLYGSGEHGGNGQEERKFSGCSPAESLAHTANDGRCAPAEPWKKDGQYLEATDPESDCIGYLFFIVDRGVGKEPVYEEEEDTSDDHHCSDKVQVAQCVVDMFFEKEPEYEGWDHRNDQLDIKAQPGEIEEFLVIDHHNGEDGCQLDNDLEHIRKRSGCYADDRIRELHVGGGRDREELGQPFYDRENDSLDDCHVGY